ncbi:hypothetical protein MUP29_01555 [bacterium]|nr:hypothetical protein [bacterium]
MRSFVYAITLFLIALPCYGSRLELSIVPVPEASPTTPLLNGQIPHSRVAHGGGVIAKAYLSSPTRRYAHRVLGDEVEAASLTLVLDDGKELRYELPESRVFEDLEPRLVNLDAKGPDEVMADEAVPDKIVVVESDSKLGASLAVYGLSKGGVEKIAATPFIGHAYRWLNPIGAGDFNGDSVIDLALVSTPHIGGVLKLFSYTPPNLTSYAQMRGVSTHSIGSTALGMGRVVKGELKDLILAPSQQHNQLLLLEWIDGKIVEKARVALPASIGSDLVPAGYNQWTFRLKNGTYYTVKAIP